MRHKVIKLVAVALSVGFGQAALAADMPVKAAPMAVVPFYNWTGWYLGGNIGGVSGRFNDPISTPAAAAGGGFPALAADSVAYSATKSSFTGGVQGGYRWQMNKVVLGLEASANWRDINTTVIETAPGTGGSVFVLGDNFSARSRWDAAFRGSLGYAWDRWLVYATGGLALADVKVSANFITTVSGGITFPASSGSQTKTLVGGTIGAGAAYAINQNWSLGAEYRYTDYGSSDFSLGTVAGASNGIGGFEYLPVSGHISLKTHEATLRLNYRF